jgi:hypothetical protein
MVSLLMYSCEITNQQVYGIMGRFKIDNQMSFGGLCMQGCNGTHFCPIEMFKVRSLSIFDHYIKCSNSCTFVFNGPSVFSCSPSVSWSLCIME